MIVDLAESGKSVIVISSELPEVIGLCDRVLRHVRGQNYRAVRPGRTGSGKHHALRDGRKLRWVQKKQRSVDWGNFAILAVLLLMIIVLTIMNPVFLSMDNLVNIARQISMVAIVAIGMTFCADYRGDRSFRGPYCLPQRDYCGEMPDAEHGGFLFPA